MEKERPKKERSREESIDKEKKSKEISCKKDIFIYSNENYKNKSALKDNFEITPFENYDLTLFEKKKKAEELFIQMKKEHKISIEDILLYDNTNKIIQMEYLNIVLDILLKEKDKNRIELLTEKISKAGIICDEKDYNKAISRLPNDYQEKVKYKNYKNILINSLKSISSFKDKNNTKEIFDSFQFHKKYEFNHESQIGENNYYFYCLIYQIIISDIFHILSYVNYYKPYISRIITFLQKYNFSLLNEEQRSYFEYLFRILTDKYLPPNSQTQSEQLQNYLNSYEDIYLNGDKEKSLDDNSIKDINVFFNELNKSISNNNNCINYTFEAKDNKINVNMIDESVISRSFKQFKNTYSYDITIFNKEMLRVIKNTLTNNNFYNFESIFMKNLKYGMEYKPSEEFYDKYKETIIKILKSKAAKTYFEKYYSSKNKKLIYHFNRNTVIEEIFKRIKFCTIYTDGDQGYTSPLDLKIYINCIPGDYNRLIIHPFERKIMQFSRLILISIHEILGHFLRRYYSYLTNNLVKFGTKEDDYFKTGVEGGIFVEKKLLGLSIHYSLSLNQALGFLKENFETAPILYKSQIPKEELEIIIKNNPYFFDFISENMEPNKISIDELHEYLWEGFKPQATIHCGSRRENVVYINKQNFSFE